LLTRQRSHFAGDPEKARELAAVKPGAYLVNIGRGETIDQESLIAALRNGPLGGAGLDVMVPEPLNPDSPLWDMDNVILTPHTSGPHRGYQDGCCQIFAENLRRYVRGQEFINRVDIARGY
jgi:phosphoglycerate dehydrogenase-like enzyme